MRACFALFAALALVSCDWIGSADPTPAESAHLVKAQQDWRARQPRPSVQLVDHIETLLTREPCVRGLPQWVRLYSYDRLRDGTFDTGIVDFALQEAANSGLKAERRITAPSSWASLEYRPARVVVGDYDIKEDRVRIAFCGKNNGEAGPGDVDNGDAYDDELERRRTAHIAAAYGL